MSVTAAAVESAQGDLGRLVHRGLDARSFSSAAARIVRNAVPADGTCLLSVDPATLLPTGEFVENALSVEATVRLTEIEMREPDFNKFHVLARSRQRAASLSAVTAGQLDRSRRQRELRRPGGFADELRVACSDETGTWGALTLLREAGRSHFTAADVQVAASLAGPLADGLRRAALLGSGPVDERDDVGLFTLTADNAVDTGNRAAERWLDELAHPDRPAPAIPVVVLSVAGRARAMVGDGNGRPARARVRTAGARWVVVRGSVLGAGPQAPVAIIVEPARPPDLAPLIADLYGLTERERRVTELVARGFSTSAIADQLHLSAYTVQDHLKSIFDKSGAGSRGDLVARLFFDHYAPRLSSPTGTD